VKRVVLLFTVLLLLPFTCHAECRTCGIERREKEAKNVVKYPPPPAARGEEVSSEKLYKKFPLRRPQTATSIASYPVTVYPEKTVWLMLSNTDVNRIVCLQGDVEYVYTSKEKGVVTEIRGDELYVKFKALLDQQTGKLKRIRTPTEFYVRCAGETFSFIAKPRRIPSRTVYLKSLKQKVKPPEDLMKKDSLTSALVEVIRSVFLGRIPPSWEKVKKEKVNVIRILDDVKVRISEKEDWKIPGLPVLVRLFSVSASKRVQIGEKLLLDASITKNPVAISLLDHVIEPGTATLAVIVEREG